MCGCDFDAPSAFTRYQRKARLVHTCESCGRPILRGEVYDYASGVWDGAGRDCKRHVLCAELEDGTRRSTECGVPLGGLFEAKETWDEAPAVFRRAWETVFLLSWDRCEDCGAHLPYRHVGPRCPSCMDGEEDLWAATQCP